MGLFDIAAILVTLAAVFSYVNARWLKMPMTIALMLMSLIVSISAMVLGQFHGGVETELSAILGAIDFNRVLMGGMLSFLLFAGALHVNLNDLLEQKVEVAVFATLGVVASTVLVGFSTYWLCAWLGVPLTLMHCLLFGALISPTDPIAVLGMLRRAGAPKSLEMKIAGESLFNDGIGVVVFAALLGIATGRHEATVGGVALMLLQEAVGGVLLGLLLGYVGYRILKTIDNYQAEILVTLAIVTGGYALAMSLHTSGPLAIVVAGLLIGNHGRKLAMSDKTREHLDTFWELLDGILNAILFVLIGLEALVFLDSPQYLLLGLAAVAVVLLARFLTVGAVVGVLRRFRPFAPRAVRVITWAGLRGGISVALVLVLVDEISSRTAAGAAFRMSQGRQLLTMTYVVVAFSILVQGLTIKRVVPKRLAVSETNLDGRQASRESHEHDPSA